MFNREQFTFLRYYAFLFIVASIILAHNKVTNSLIIFLLVFLVNNQLRFFTLEKVGYKAVSFILELFFTVIFYKMAGGYLIFYLILESIDSNILFEKALKIIFDLSVILIGIYLSYNQSLEFKIINLGVLGAIMSILYFVQRENSKKLKAQELYDKLRTSEEKLLKANKELEVYASSVEELTLLKERNRLSREIHDSVGHALSAIVIQLGAIERIVGKNDETAVELTSELKKFVQNSLNDVRNAVRELKPKEFEQFEGILMIQELVNNFKKLSGVEVRLGFSKEKYPLTSDQSFTFYRIIQEFLSNSLRHGKATLIQVFIGFSENSILLTLNDNGIGADNITEGVGLRSMKERAAELGGIFEYKTKAGEGFLVKVQINKGDKYGKDKDYIG